MDALLNIASNRMLTLEDVGLTPASGPQAVREHCDAIAGELVARYLARGVDWPQADQIANHLFELMIRHCGGRVPEYAWEVFLAFDEGEIDRRGDAHTRPRIEEIVSRHRAV